MRLIQRQGLKYSIVNFGGLALGMLSTFFVYPYTVEEVGLIRFLLDTSTLLFPLLSLGVNSLSVRYFPHFEDEATGNHGFLGMLLLIGLSSAVLFTLGILPFWSRILAFYANENPLYQQYLWLMFPLIFLTLINTILNQYSINFKRIVVPSLLFDISQKIALPLLLIAYLLKWLDLTMLLYGVILHAVVVLCGFCWYLFSLKAVNLKPDWSFIPKDLRRDMIFFAIFGMVSSAGYMVVNKIDTWVVGTFVGLKSNGIYNIAAYIAGVLQIPMRAIVNISVPLVSKHWYENNYAELGILYRKASLNILLPGLLFFGAFGVSIDPFFAVIPNGKVLIAGKAVVIILGIAKLIDMGTGLNNHLLSYSKEYKLALISITILAGMTLGFNWLLVPKYGLVGVALATLISTTCYNLNSVFIIWYKYKLQPFSRKTVYAVGLAAALFLLIWLIPVVFNPYVMILLKSGLYCLLYGGIVLYSRISPDLNDLVSRLLEMGQKFIGK